ncbi:MAG: glycoside hydrolase family 38 C-terminal domain-containing protein [Candidatus Methylacidiphilales bacterium]|nr:glycoside hydrolase family 38 C-terminal domain-containing protein [Candidatus Methylacidiphilales bacterium]
MTKNESASQTSFKDFEGTVHLVFSSHWDREWYFPFQKFRGKLVSVLDHILDELESGRLPAYQMDGQFIPVEDYLEIRPEKEALLRKLVVEDRLKVGPWYNLPDEFLVSGESLVRNFLMGMRRSEAFGETSKVGWLCDIFGHNSQMPQVLTQLGMNDAVLWRGIDTKLSNPFQWKSPDGSTILVHRFLENGYCDFDFDVRKCNIPDARPTVDEMVESAAAYLKKTQPASTARTLMWFDGGDHIEFDPAVLEVVSKVNQLAGRELIRISNLDDFMEALRTEMVGAPADMTVTGELREPASMDTKGWLIPGVGSSRIPLKQANHAGETLLTLWAEPWCAAANFSLGMEYPTRALELAWEYLLKNHPHDSICGCSTDDTHAAMPYRFEQSRHIAEFHLSHALRSLTAAATREYLKTGDIALGLFAPIGGTEHRSPEAFVRIPKDWPQFSEFFEFEAKPSLRIYNLEGREVAYQLLQVIPTTTHLRVPLNHFPAPSSRQGIRIAIDTTLTPGAEQHFVLKRAEGPTRIALQNAIGVSRNTLRNELVEVRAANDGTLSLKDLQSGAEYHGLLAVEDTADIGDGWFHGIALQDRAYLSTGGTTTFGITENGPLLARLHVRVEWQVPAGFDFISNKRSERLVPCVVEHLVTLRKGNAYVEIETTVHNTTSDHRLRVFCATGLEKAEFFSSDTPFDSIERPIKLREDNHHLRELQVEMTPQQNWVAASDGERGLALLAPGQYESAVLDQPDRPLCLTLLRGFRRAVFTDGNEGGQIHGVHKFRMALKPFDGTVPATDLYNIAQTLAAPVRSEFLDVQDLLHMPKPAVGSARAKVRPSVRGNVVVSAAYHEGNQWIFRVFNPTDMQESVLLWGGETWEATDMRGDNAVSIDRKSWTIEPRQIVTLRARTA